ncbi:MAG TPA: metallophosphoesterase [Actinophytocola sp.]|uniref:metallophosphoesterase n=1 Tax=Actinophytocola sp. TaxID=1872138 RepID=UPI002DDDB71B|nr:metallophosphoesterase [Actinophytocola sp.]HEV2779202.1 metallophosphoesterase [Actinophytocola sp.]
MAISEPIPPVQTPPVRTPVARPRPTDMSEEQLGFRPQAAVRWLAPGVLITTGAQSLIAAIFGSFADKRELQGSLPATVHRHDTADELWLDYVADVGDGFDATFSVASLLGAESVELPGVGTLPRGRLLVLGGDEVYPAASTRAYEDRSKGVYRAALPVPQGDAPTLFALPANHDWYDGLTAFLRVFAQRRPFGGWKTEQTRSYFAIQLPRRWWLFAIDTQFDDYVDAPQLEYFRTVSERLRKGDGVILCTSTPSWVSAGSGGESKGYDTIEFFNREIIRPSGAAIRVMLTGDRHHYARYAEVGGTGQRITCGLGGAYTSATHKLPEHLELPPPKSRVREPAGTARFDLVTTYPDKAASRALAGGIFRLPWRNPTFWALTGFTQTAMTLAMLIGIGELGTGTFRLLAAWAPAVVVAVVLVLGAVAFARIDLPKSAKTNTFAGVLHAAAHLGLSLAWAAVIRWLDIDVLPGGLGADLTIVAIVAIGTPVLIGFIDAEIVAAYLLLASMFCVNLNEAFAGQSIEDHKGFLRLHIDATGTLTIYPVKLPVVCRKWKAHPTGAPSEPWLLPDGQTLRPELIEEPIRIPRSVS